MNFKEEILSRIPDAPNLKGIISGASLKREVDLQTGNMCSVLIVTTERKLTLEGGNGWDGIDAKDVEIIRKAIHGMLSDNNAEFMIDKFEIREAHTI